jgi:hypothetical protein
MCAPWWKSISNRPPRADSAKWRIIHGRGIGEIRRQVHDILRRHSAGRALCRSARRPGGWGATLAWLRPGARRPIEEEIKHEKARKLRKEYL